MRGPDPATTVLLGCATVVEEMLPILPEGMDHEIFDFGLHLRPGGLRSALQEAIDAREDRYDTILLGYGLCSMAVIGLRSRRATLAMPRVDDCIGAFLGGQRAYREVSRAEPGTYYLTKGWIEVGDTIYDEFLRAQERYGEERARRIFRTMLRNYRRLVYIDTGNSDQDRHREYAAMVAREFGLDFAEIRGTRTVVATLLHGPWDEEILVVPPGREITYADFQLPGEQGRPALFANSPTGV